MRSTPSPWRRPAWSSPAPRSASRPAPRPTSSPAPSATSPPDGRHELRPGGAAAARVGGGGHVVVLTGGVRTPSDALVGPVAVSALQGLHVDRLFLGAHGIDRKAGLTTPNLVEAETNRALVRASRSVCVLADHTKVRHRRALDVHGRCARSTPSSPTPASPHGHAPSSRNWSTTSCSPTWHPRCPPCAGCAARAVARRGEGDLGLPASHVAPRSPTGGRSSTSTTPPAPPSERSTTPASSASGRLPGTCASTPSSATGSRSRATG